MPADGGIATDGGEILSVAGLTVAYGESRVLFNVGLSVAPRQTVACVGRNGAG